MSRARWLIEDRASRPPLRGLWILAAILALPGCAVGLSSRQLLGQPSGSHVVAPVTAATAALFHAQELDRRGDERAVDYYYRAAVQSAIALRQAQACDSDCGIEAVYCQALSGLIDAGQRYMRLDPRSHLRVTDGGTRVVPLRYFGFAWRPNDFSRLTSADRHASHDIGRHFVAPGLGVALVAERVACAQETFFRPWQPFAVTAVLRSSSDLADVPAADALEDYVLELYNPLAFDTVNWGNIPRPLARDLTAPLAAIVNEAPRQYLRGFTAPSDTAVQPQLVMLEPYQPGKIPAVFIHGLYSDPITWVDMVNELRAHRDLYEQYQFWMFRYPTGGDLLESAAVLRQQMQLVRDTFDPQHADPAMDQVVLVGHSLGGLMSKLQVTASYDILWREIAVQPLAAVRAPPDEQMRLWQAFFFEATPTVKRVIFIGTPHRGSGMARRLAGRVGSALVNYGSEEDAQYRQLIDNNPHVFMPYLVRRRPTTIDLLEPDSPLLSGLAKMPVNCATRLHSIIGTGGANPFAEPGDGVVAVSSARHFGDSELFVRAKHEKLHRHPASIHEVARILRIHAAQAP